MTLEEHLERRLTELRASGRLIASSEIWDGAAMLGLRADNTEAEIVEYIPPAGLVLHTRTMREMKWREEVLSPEDVLTCCRDDIAQRRETGSGDLPDHILRELLRSSLSSSLNAWPLLVHFTGMGAPEAIAQELDWLETSRLWPLFQRQAPEQWAKAMQAPDSGVRALVQRLYTRVQLSKVPPKVKVRAR